MRPAVADIESPNPNNGPSFAGAVAEDYGPPICGLVFIGRSITIPPTTI